jgi:DNA-directed RNA polymerase subunit RPC12/RpoP
MSGSSRQTVKAVVSVIVIVAAGFFAVRAGLKYWNRYVRPKGLPPLDQVWVKCEQCDEENLLDVEGEPKWPVKCPSCENITATQLYVCYDCKAHFPGKAEGVTAACPLCGSPNVGGAPKNKDDWP